MTIVPTTPTISGCIRGSGGLLRDVHSLLAYAEEQLGTHGHWPLRGDKEAVRLSNKFDEPERWMPDVIYRAYAKLPDPKALEPVTEVRFVEVHLIPSFAADAVVLMAKAELEAPANRREIWDGWSTYIGNAVAGTVNRDQVVEIDATAAKKVHGLAKKLLVRAVPLAVVADREAVRTEILQALLEL